MSNIADAGGISDAFDEAGLETITTTVDGLSVHLGGRSHGFSLIGEYTRALNSFADTELAWQGAGAEPSAWNIELAYTTTLIDRETVFAIGYQGSDEAVSLGLPEERFLAAIGMVLFDGTSLTLEYYRDQDYSAAEDGTGEEGYGLTAQLAYEF